MISSKISYFYSNEDSKNAVLFELYAIEKNVVATGW